MSIGPQTPYPIECLLEAAQLPDLCLPLSMDISENASARYDEIRRLYEQLASHEDSRLHAAASRGLEWARTQVDHERRYERDEEVFGFDEARRRRYR